jgi:hypothetical protein
MNANIVVTHDLRTLESMVIVYSTEPWSGGNKRGKVLSVERRLTVERAIECGQSVARGKILLFGVVKVKYDFNPTSVVYTSPSFPRRVLDRVVVFVCLVLLMFNVDV